MRSILALGAAGLAAVAAVVSQLDGDPMEVGFFGILAGTAGIAAVAFLPGAGRGGRILGSAIAAAWTTAGVWIGVLLVMYVAACSCSRPVTPAEATYLGLTATIYHLIAMYVGNALVLVAAFGRSTFHDRPVGQSGRLG